MYGVFEKCKSFSNSGSYLLRGIRLKKFALRLAWYKMIYLLYVWLKISVISREIRPLAALYPLPHTKKCCIGLQSYAVCAPFYCISLRNIYGRWCNAAKGLISRDIVKISYFIINRINENTFWHVIQSFFFNQMNKNHI